MHVLLIPSWYKLPEAPLAGTFFEEQARMLTRLGFRVGIFCPQLLRFSSRWHAHSLPFTPHADDFVDDGLPTYYLFVKKLVPFTRSLNYSYLCRQADRKLAHYFAKHGKPTLVHSHAVFSGGIVAAHVARRYDLPLIHTEHQTSLVLEGKLERRRMARRLESVFGQAERCIAVSTKLRDDLLANYQVEPSKMAVVPNVVAPAFLEAASCKRLDAPFVFFTNSFLTERKNHKLLFEAFKKVVERRPETVLKVGGKSYTGLGEQLVRQVHELDLADKVHFLGELSRDRVVAELRDSHAFVLASRYETFGVVLIEALAVGRPVVATDSGGPRDIVNDENGVLVQDHDAEHLAAGMLELMDRYETFDQEAISRRCGERYSEAAIGQRLVTLYQDALG